MEKKFMKYLLFGVFTFVLGIAFVGCGEDYDDDISSLKNEDVALKSALEKAVSDLQGQITALANAPGGGNYDAIIATINGQIQTLQDAVKKLEDADGTGGGGDLDYDAIADELVKHEDFVAAIIAEISKSNPDLVTLLDKVNSLITKIEVVGYNGYPTEGVLSFNALLSTPATYDFGGSRDGTIHFVNGQITKEAVTYKVLVKVSPANASLTSEQISLVDNQGNDLSDYITAKAAPYTALVTKADESVSSGLYEITFTLKVEAYTKDALNQLTLIDKNGDKKLEYDKDKKILFAIAAKTDTGRYVSTDYEYEIKHSAIPFHTIDETTKKWIELAVTSSKSNKNIEDLYNTNTVQELIWKSGASFVNSNDQSALAAAGTADNRRGREYFAIDYDTPFEITMSGRSSTDAFAYYIDFDLQNASASDKTLWEGARGSIEGLNKVYLAKDKASLTIKSPTLQGKAIGFRVYLVNYDGTLVDPDGRAFYVACGGQTYEGSKLEFVTTELVHTSAPYGRTAPVNTEPIAFSLPTGVNALDIASVSLTTDITDNGGVKIGDLGGNIARQTSSGGPTTTWASTRFLVINNLRLSYLKDEGVHTGKLELKSVTGNTIASYDVTIKKTLPEFPTTATALALKNAISTDKPQVRVKPVYTTATSTPPPSPAKHVIKSATYTTADVFSNLATFASGITDPSRLSFSVSRGDKVIKATGSAVASSEITFEDVNNGITVNEPYDGLLEFNWGPIAQGNKDYISYWKGPRGRGFTIEFYSPVEYIFRWGWYNNGSGASAIVGTSLDASGTSGVNLAIPNDGTATVSALGRFKTNVLDPVDKPDAAPNNFLPIGNPDFDLFYRNIRLDPANKYITLTGVLSLALANANNGNINVNALEVYFNGSAFIIEATFADASQLFKLNPGSYTTLTITIHLLVDDIFGNTKIVDTPVVLK
ncbi:hypothetical protein EZS27_007409 [termite gut metagenome]|uniref:Uncharacterized protein n=1 Tax=termite gut metagenome TaxID=433724 RepID=A0A5J4SFP5_9ZZZZ